MGGGESSGWGVGWEECGARKSHRERRPLISHSATLLSGCAIIKGLLQALRRAGERTLPHLPSLRKSLLPRFILSCCSAQRARQLGPMRGSIDGCDSCDTFLSPVCFFFFFR